MQCTFEGQQVDDLTYMVMVYHTTTGNNQTALMVLWVEKPTECKRDARGASQMATALLASRSASV